MAQHNIKSVRDESISTKQQASSTRYQTSFSQPTPSSSSNEEKPDLRRHLTLPIQSDNGTTLSKAELYIAAKSKMLSSPIEQKTMSPETPSPGHNVINPIGCLPSHAELMNRWHREQAVLQAKKQKHRYVYG